MEPASDFRLVFPINLAMPAREHFASARRQDAHPFMKGAPARESGNDVGEALACSLGTPELLVGLLLDCNRPEGHVIMFNYT